MSDEPFIRVRGVQSDRTIGAEERTARLPPGRRRSGPIPRTDRANLLLLLLRQGFGRWLGLRPGDALAHVLAAVVVHRGSHAHVHREPLARLAAIHTADWRHVAIVAAVGDADVARRGRHAERRVEAQPADLRDEEFRPGVRRLSANNLVRARRGLRRFWWRQIAGD